MTEQLTIKKADIKDAGVLRALSVTTFLETFAKDNTKEDMDQYIADDMSMDRLTEELQDPYSQFYIAWYNDDAAGYCKIRTSKVPDELRNNRPMEIERIYVLQRYQGKKVGYALMGHCLQLATQLGHDMVWLGVWEHNYKAVNFYKQWGFELFGSHDFWLGSDRQTDVLMKRALPL